MDLWTTAGRWIPRNASESQAAPDKPSLAVAVTMWVTVLLPYIGLVAAVAFAFTGGIAWIDLAVMAVCYLAVGFGVTIGYHRLLTHRAFSTTRWKSFSAWK